MLLFYQILPCHIGKFYVIVKNNNTVSPAGKYPVVINPVAGHNRQQVGSSLSTDGKLRRRLRAKM